MRQISRDPFARSTLYRESERTSATCDWCGRKRNDGRLYRYGTLDDGIATRTNFHKGWFCSKDCHDAYHT